MGLAGYTEKKCLCFGILDGEWISLRSHLGSGDCEWFSFWFCHVLYTKVKFIQWKWMELKKIDRRKAPHIIFNDTFLLLFERILWDWVPTFSLAFYTTVALLGNLFENENFTKFDTLIFGQKFYSESTL